MIFLSKNLQEWKKNYNFAAENDKTKKDEESQCLFLRLLLLLCNKL